MLHVTRGMLHVTHDTLHVTCDRYEEALACAMTLMHGKMTADMTGQFVKKAIRGEM